MKIRFAWLVAVMALSASLSAQDKKADAKSNVTGVWQMGLQGDHVVPVGMELEQDGTKVTGTVLMPTQHVGRRVEVSMAGEFANGRLEVSGSVEGAAEPTKIEITATMKDDGTLEGKLSTPKHSVPMTAERLRPR